MVMSFCMYAAFASGDPDLDFAGQTFEICHQILIMVAEIFRCLRICPDI